MQSVLPSPVEETGLISASFSFCGVDSKGLEPLVGIGRVLLSSVLAAADSPNKIQ